MSEKITLFEKLTKRFESRVIQPWGKVTIIPNHEFQKQWIPQLEKEGCKVFGSSLGNEMCFFIRGSNQVLSQGAESATHEEATNSWSEKDTQELKRLYLDGVSGKEIARRLKKTTHEIAAAIRNRIPDEIKRQRKSKLEATDKGSSAVNSSKPEKPIRKRGIPFSPEEKEEFEILCRQGLTAKEISAKMNKSVFVIGAKLRHFRKTNNPEKPIKEAAEDDPVKEYLSACSILYPSHPKTCVLLLQAASNKILEETTGKIRKEKQEDSL